MNNRKVRKSKTNEKNEKVEKQTSAEKLIDSDTSQDTSILTSLRQRQLQEQLMQHQSSKDVVSNELHLFKKQVVQQIENQILNSQKRLEEQLHEELEVFEKSINKTLTEIREQHYYEIKSEEVNSRERSMEKIFKYKPSLLSEMMKQSDYKTLYHMIVASMFALMMNLWVQDYVQQNIIFDMDTFFWCFQNPFLVASIWCGLTLSCYVSVYWVHYCYNHKVNPILGVTIFSIHQSVVILYACSITIHLVFGFGSRMIIMCEAVRMIMKNYSYARNKMLYGTNNNRKYFITNYWLTKGITKENVILPDITIGTLSQEFKRYTYFFFAPTLLYRDHYVKAPHQSRRKIIIEFSNFFLCIYYGFILFRTFCKQPILDLRENLTLTNFILTLFKLMMPSTFSLVLVFFGLLHSWFNGWAELLRFPDRTFYLDWWSSSEFGQYYRKWNVVVHEFLYYYVYLDSDKLSRGRRSKLFSQFVTFGASAIIHEIILTVAMGFFYPICFLLFTGPGILFINQGKKLVKKSWVNIIFWLQLYLGTSLMITLYLTEYYARQRIDDDKMYNIWGIFHYLIPRTIYLITGTGQ